MIIKRFIILLYNTCKSDINLINNYLYNQRYITEKKTEEIYIIINFYVICIPTALTNCLLIYWVK